MYRKRAFLNPISTGQPAFVFAVAESSDNGEKDNANYVLTLADCKRMIELEFPLTSARMRRQSLAKVDLLADVISRFRDAVHAEAELIEKAK